jgi:hypothetical protein
MTKSHDFLRIRLYSFTRTLSLSGKREKGDRQLYFEHDECSRLHKVRSKPASMRNPKQSSLSLFPRQRDYFNRHRKRSRVGWACTHAHRIGRGMVGRKHLPTLPQ